MSTIILGTVVVVFKGRLERKRYMGVWSLEAKLRVRMIINMMTKYVEGTR
jgi:hypothetical protein